MADGSMSFRLGAEASALDALVCAVAVYRDELRSSHEFVGGAAGAGGGEGQFALWLLMEAGTREITRSLALRVLLRAFDCGQTRPLISARARLNDELLGVGLDGS